jgi:hypothetical protein
MPGIGGCPMGGTCATDEFCFCGFGRLITLFIASFAFGTIVF